MAEEEIVGTVEEEIVGTHPLQCQLQTLRRQGRNEIIDVHGVEDIVRFGFASSSCNVATLLVHPDVTVGLVRHVKNLAVQGGHCVASSRAHELVRTVPHNYIELVPHTLRHIVHCGACVDRPARPHNYFIFRLNTDIGAIWWSFN